MQNTDVVLILGSGPDAPDAANWARGLFDRIVVINNAWRIRPDWTDLIYPEDFPADRHPPSIQTGQSIVQADAFVPAQNAYGGFVYAGGTMAYTAAYWALHALKPRILAFKGCDMVYPKTGATHFYGTGAADPLRDDISLRDLKAKSARLALLALGQGCRCVNLSVSESVLVFPRQTPENLRDVRSVKEPLTDEVEGLLAQEKELGYMVPSGRYWEEAERFDSNELAKLDQGWRAAWQAVS